jgi:hypothetical protein
MPRRLTHIRDERTEGLNWIPGHFEVQVDVQEVWACSCGDGQSSSSGCISATSSRSSMTAGRSLASTSSCRTAGPSCTGRCRSRLRARRRLRCRGLAGPARSPANRRPHRRLRRSRELSPRLIGDGPPRASPRLRRRGVAGAARSWATARGARDRSGRMGVLGGVRKKGNRSNQITMNPNDIVFIKYVPCP